MKSITVRWNKGAVLKGRIRLPHSKSISNRLLILQELAKGPFELHHLSEADDTELLKTLLQEIRQKNGMDSLVELDCRNAGTVMRFLTAYLSLVPGKWMLTGSPRMLERPIGTLVDSLNYMGAQVDYLAKLGYPPLLIRGSRFAGKEIVIDPGISSQFISALLMIAPKLPGGLDIRMSGSAVSMPYINMTVKLLQHFSVKVETSRNSIRVHEGKIVPRAFMVEADWSAAAAWYEMAAFASKADLFLEGLTVNSLQGDAILASVYHHFGVESEFLEEGVRIRKVAGEPPVLHFNFTDHPDIAQPLITTAAMLGTGGNFQGLATLKIKETDRLEALAEVLRQFGVPVSDIGDHPKNPGLEIGKCSPAMPPGLRISTYGDHRMAMSFAPLAILFGEVTLNDPEVVRKSYPGFWDDLASAGFLLS